MFGEPAAEPKCDVVDLGELVNFYSGGTPSKQSPEFWKGDLPWFSPKDLKRSELVDSIDHVSEDVLTRTPLRAVPADTVLIVVRGMILAHTVPISIVRTTCTINQDLKALIPRVAIDPLFLRTALEVQHAQLLSRVSTAAHGTKRLEMRDLKAIRIARPGAKREQEFASRAASATVLHRDLLAQERLLAGFMAALQSRAFSGQL